MCTGAHKRIIIHYSQKLVLKWYDGIVLLLHQEWGTLIIVMAADSNSVSHSQEKGQGAGPD